jgi:hypothetical protein
MKPLPNSLELIGRDGAWYVRLAPAANRKSALAEFAGQELFGRRVSWSSAADRLSIQVVGDLEQACQTGTCLALIEQMCSSLRD